MRSKDYTLVFELTNSCRAANEQTVRIAFSKEPLTFCRRTNRSHCVKWMNHLRFDSSLANVELFCACIQLFDALFGNVLQRTENYRKPLITVELTTFNAHQRVSTNVKISPHAERTLSQLVIVYSGFMTSKSTEVRKITMIRN